MRAARSICTVGLCCLLLSACADTTDAGPEIYVVRPDDTLYSVAWRHNLDFRDLARWNGIGADLHIAVGQVLVLGPGKGLPAERRAPSAAPAPPSPQPTFVPPAPTATAPRAAGSSGQASPLVGKPRALPNSAPAAAKPRSAAPPTRPAERDAQPASGVPNGPQPRWAWPTDRLGAPRPVQNGGILLAGRLGQDVRAASAGRVVYTGSGLRGYGNLIIIKHADNLLSAYAHNREILVRDGQDVLMGQVIAHMGEAIAQSPILYFEIRQSGRPVDPLRFLPK